MTEWKKRTKLCVWFAFLFFLILTCILSFQSGSSTRGLDQPIIAGLEENGNGMSEEMILTVIFYIRQAGRAVLFALLGVSGGAAALLTWEKRPERVRVLGMGIFLLVFSYLTEKLKIFIEGRHYAFGEFVESFLCALVGLLCACFLLKRLTAKDAATRGRKNAQNKNAI